MTSGASHKQIVDFCCGSNDFSCLMKEKLDKAGKSCSFKNYDLIQAKVNLQSYFGNMLSLYSDGSLLIC